MSFQYTMIDHVQLAMPVGEENKARDFFVHVLKFKETPKPISLRARGGVWFQAGSVHIHLGVEHPFAPAKKAHPAIRVKNIAVMKDHLIKENIDFSVDVDLPGANRFYLSDPFGNRLEFLEWVNVED